MRTVRAGVVVALLGVLAACGGGGDGVDPVLVSSPDQPFEIVAHDDARYVVGHGVTLEMGPGWTDYQPEQEGADGTTDEWAVGLPVEEGTFPSGLQFSMGKPGVGAQIDTLPDAARELAELSKGYELVEEGEREVPGIEKAAFLHFVPRLRSRRRAGPARAGHADDRGRRRHHLHHPVPRAGGAVGGADAGGLRQRRRDSLRSSMIT